MKNPFRKEKVEEQLDPKFTTIEYYKFSDPCYKCGQLIINGIFYPNTVKEKCWRELEGTIITGNKSEEIKDGYHMFVMKQFYYHWKCPTKKVEIPEEILKRCDTRSY